VTRAPYPACPLCDGPYSPDREGAYQDQPIPWVVCDACGHSFTAGYFTDEALQKILGAVTDCQRVGYRHEDLRLPCSRIVERVAQFTPSGYWFDVGFGNGSLMFTAAEFGYYVSGCDLRAETVEQMRQVGFDAWCVEFTQLASNAHVISLCDVLEHMPFPKPALRHAHRLLLGGGSLLVSCPNMDSPSAEFHTSAGTNPYWDEIEHFHNFGRARLYALLRECGFEPVSYAVSERYRLGMEIIARPV
jgi:SAM-dependent methyltransferase